MIDFVISPQVNIFQTTTVIILTTQQNAMVFLYRRRSIEKTGNHKK